MNACWNLNHGTESLVLKLLSQKVSETSTGANSERLERERKREREREREEKRGGKEKGKTQAFNLSCF